MMDFSLDGHNYKSAHLDARKQFHVARRLGTVVASIGDVLEKAFGDANRAKATLVAFRKGDGDSLLDLNIDFVAAFRTLAMAVGDMKEEDADYIISTCLGVVMRQQEGGAAWAPVIAPNGRLMFADIQLPQMLQMVWHVLQENLGGFTPTQQRTSTGQATA